MDSQNQVMGDSMGIDLPQKPVDETAINELKHKAKYSRSTEFKELRAKAQTRMEFYQKFLPSGQPIGTATPEEMKGKWDVGIRSDRRSGVGVRKAGFEVATERAAGGFVLHRE